jgi:hypothetical protein
VEIYFHEFPHFLLEIFGFLLHIQSSPINTLDILEPFISDQLIPHGERNTSSRVRLKDAKSILLVSEDHPNMIAL